jgi:uncharacterized protein
VLYVDSSALIKRYIRESGTDRLNAKLEEAFTLNSGIFVSVIGYAEVLATISRCLRENPRRLRKTDLFRRRFQVDWTSAFSRVELTADILDLVARLVKTHPLRGSDAIHLASAIWVRNTLQNNLLVFVASDNRLKNAASLEGMTVFDPER